MLLKGQLFSLRGSETYPGENTAAIAVEVVDCCCGVQCRWMLVSMWTWLWIVRRTRAVRTATSLARTVPPTLTTATTARTCWTHLVWVQLVLRQTRGGRSTWEWHWRSTASHSPTETSIVRMHCGVCNEQVAQLSQRDRAAGWVSNGQKWKTGTKRQYLRTI